jgi:hypothetical protein
VFPPPVYRENIEIKFKKSQSNKGKYYKGFWKSVIRKKIIEFTDRKINFGRE